MPTMPLLYDMLLALFGQQRQAWQDVRHLKTFIWMVVGVIEEMKVHLPAWAPYVRSRATQAASTVRRFARWLHNPRIQVGPIWAAYMRHVLQDWEGRVYLALDTTSLWGEFCWIRVSLCYRGRGIPLAWRVVRHSSVRVGFALYQAVVQQAAQAIPDHLEVVLLADRGFCDLALMRFLRDTLHWHWRIRIKNTFLVYKPGRGWRQVRRFTPPPGHAVYWHHVYLGQERFGPVHLAVARPVDGRAYWYVVSDEPTGPHTLDEYGLRPQVEENILDDKSNGFQVESSYLHSAAALERLALVLAAATLVLVLQGVQVVASGKRRWVDPHWTRGESYLKIGRKYLMRVLYHGGEVLRRLLLPPGDDPEPAQASRHRTRRKPHGLIASCEYVD